MNADKVTGLMEKTKLSEIEKKRIKIGGMMGVMSSEETHKLWQRC